MGLLSGIMRCGGKAAPALLLLALAFPRPVGADAPPNAPHNAYETPSALREEMAAVGPNPFAAAPAGSTPVPAPPAVPVPANQPALSLRQAYVLDDAAILPLPLDVPNPFAVPSSAPPLPGVPKEMAADWHQRWRVTWQGNGWDALEAAWTADPVAVRRRFRADTGRGWPETAAEGPRADAMRLAATRWVRAQWNAAVAARVTEAKTKLALRGPVTMDGTLNASLDALSAGEAALNPGPVLAPRLTGDAWVNRYGAGFLLRLAADLGNRIPLPTLDLRALQAADAAWAAYWVDECVRNGVAGLLLQAPGDARLTAAMTARLALLKTAGVYLPPPSEIGVLVSLDTAALEPGAWTATFRAYAALRQEGLWPNFVSDEQVTSGKAGLERFSMLIVPAAAWCDDNVRDTLLEWARGGGALIVTDPWAFSRNEDGSDISPAARSVFGWQSAVPRPDVDAGEDTGPFRVTPAPGVRSLAAFQDGTPAILERRVGNGRIISSLFPLAAQDGAWNAFWRGMAKVAGAPNRPWLESVSAANVGRITGRYVPPVLPHATVKTR